MRTLLLVSLHEVNVSQPIRSTNGQLMAFTKRQPDGAFAAELTREQWDELRRTRWACPVLDTSFLIPDVKFQAEDGKIFTTLEECQAHEESLFLNEEIPEEPSLREAHHIPDPKMPTDPADGLLHSRILNAVADGSVHINDLADRLSEDREKIKAVVKESSFLKWSGPRVAMVETSIPS